MDSFHSGIHQNLRLLAQIYPNLDMESKLQKGMFKKPNTKGMQSVFYSLISILNPEYCKTHIPWPVSFTSDNYKFRAAVINFIEKECTDFETPKLLPSLLNKADGEKYVRFVFDFVTYVSRTVLNRKFNETVLAKPSIEIDCDESMNLLKCVMDDLVAKDREIRDQHKVFMQNSCDLFNATDTEFRERLQELFVKKEELATEVKDALSYTNITEEVVMERFLTDLQDEVIQLQRNQNIVESEACRIVKKKEYLLQLISSKQTMHRTLIDVNYLKSFLTEDFARVVKIPLPKIESSLFVNSDSGTQICLKTFLHLGYRLVHSMVQRFMKLNPTDNQLAVCQTVNNIFRDASKRFDDLSSLDSKISSIISNCQAVIPDLETQYQEELGLNAPYVEVFLTLKSLENYCPDLTPKLEKPLWIDTFSEAGPEEDPMQKIKRKMQGTLCKKEC